MFEFRQNISMTKFEYEQAIAQARAEGERAGRAAALEEAAKVVEEASAPYVLHTSTGTMMFRSCTEKLAAAIRALIEVKA